MPEIRTFFSSGSIIDSVLNFGLAAPIDIQVSGRHYAELFDLSRKVDARVKALPECRPGYRSARRRLAR